MPRFSNMEATVEVEQILKKVRVRMKNENWENDMAEGGRINWLRHNEEEDMELDVCMVDFFIFHFVVIYMYNIKFV